MKVLILGGSGMLGHKLWQVCRANCETWVTIRGKRSDFTTTGLFDPERVVESVDALQFTSIERAVQFVRPSVIINCIGIVKQLAAASEPLVSVPINSLLPHRLAQLCRLNDMRLIHISTDCVFSGRLGMRGEDDVPDPIDLYGRSKCLGEVSGQNCLTLRTSIIGREISSSNGLVEWLLSHNGGHVRGYTNAIYTGLTTLALSGVIANLLEHHARLEGLFHVASEPITKYALLCLIRDVFGLHVDIEADEQPRIDRSLDASRFRSATGFKPQPWTEMIRELASDSTSYREPLCGSSSTVVQQQVR